MGQRDDEWRHWAERENAALRTTIRKASTGSGHTSGDGLGAFVGLVGVALLLGVVFVLALPISYPSFLVGRLVAEAIHPLIGIIVGLGIFAACLAALYFSRIARALYAFPSAFALQLAIFLGVNSFSDLVWASGASLLAGSLLFRLAFSVMRLRDEDDPIPAWLVSGVLAIVSLAPNFLLEAYEPWDISPIAGASNQTTMDDQRPAVATPVPNSSAAISGMILPQSGRRLLAPIDVAHLSADELRLARNEIFARRGRLFTDPEIRAHFEQFDWYRPTSMEVQLSEVEAANVAFLSEQEERRAALSSEDLPAEVPVPQPPPAQPSSAQQQRTAPPTRSVTTTGPVPTRDEEQRRTPSSAVPEMVRIPGQNLEVGRYEVTFAEWDACVAAGGCNGYRPSDAGWGRGRRPVININWNDAQAYVQWLSQRTGQRYRLLTSAEWEVAARAGTTTEYSWGDQDPVCDQSARNGANFGDCADDRTRPVGSFQGNSFGLYDVHGNVWEWVEDCFDSRCSSRGLRGGSWSGAPGALGSAFRVWNNPADRSNSVGFRLARTL